jgi:hypothetical protein
VRVFKHFSWPEVGSVKMALPRPAHQRVTHTVNCNDICYTLFRLESSKKRLNLAIFDDLNM